MRRVFGAPTKKPTGPPPPSLDDASKRMDLRIKDLEMKIQKCEAELRAHAQQLKNTKSLSAQRVVKNKARRVLQQRKMYEQQLNQLQQQSFNLDQTKFNIESMRDTATAVSAMKQASQSMKSQMASLHIDDVDDLYDELADLMDQQVEMQEVMGRSYAVPDDFDEMDLDAELEALGDDAGMEEPSYLGDMLSQPGSSVSTGVDEYGLPTVPSTESPSAAPAMGF